MKRDREKRIGKILRRTSIRLKSLFIKIWLGAPTQEK
jgi:hypothetical protein